ncbi:hypothetical protein A8950_1242 [Dongia mobilis]|uniref:Uncharacterized protein n=1 Tax=Dongia mobilis TaxID=578943 RepID=A0A4V3DES3_9PROT|nr:hypothetical protein [Dongia mobilis]TDQ82960.1 hypothetical protein A8950_1242 [Dongia mobilis]
MNPRRQGMTVPCTVEIAHSAEALYAHVTLDGVDVGPGDVVEIKDAPCFVGFGGAVKARRTARVFRAGRLRRLWTRWSAFLALGHLCEVGFDKRR